MATEQTYILDGPIDFFFPFPVRTAGQIVVSIEPGGVLPASAYEVIGASATATGVTIRYTDAPRDGLSTLRIQRRTEPLRVSQFLDDLSITARALNAEFDNILQLVQDGVINEFRGEWETERLYLVLDVVVGPDDNIYVCLEQHESDDFNTDLGDGKWLLAADFSTGQANIDAALQAAEAARDKAEQWAEEDEDVEVEPGEFSAKHYSIKASDSADAALISEQNAAPVNAIVSEITTVAGIESDVIVVAGINSEVVTVAGIDSEVATVSGIAGDVITVAGIDSDVTAVAANESNVNIVAGDIANVNTVAGINADVSAVAAIDTDVTTAATNIQAIIDAPQAATDAETARDKAQQWATEAEDVPVETSPDLFSAFHWAQKAASAAQGAAFNISYDNTASGLAATDVQAAIDEIVDEQGTMSSQDANNVNITGGNVSGIVEIEPRGTFAKSNPNAVAWSKTGAGTAETGQDLYVEVGGLVRFITSGTTIAMPSLSVGTDYAIWVNPDGTLQASTSFTSAPVAGGRRVGGFHYAPGGKATGTSGGDTVAQIMDTSFYDLKWRPSVVDPRGLTLVGDGSFWAGMYHMSANHLTGPVHKYNVDPCRDGNPPQNITGSGNYPNASPANIIEALQYHGFRAPDFWEFQLLAFGTTEATSLGGSGPGLTGVLSSGAGNKQRFTSQWGVFDATGVLQHWGNDTILTTSNQTLPNPARGGRFRYSHFAHFGGVWFSGADSGSRNVAAATATLSSSAIGSRGVCDHLILD